MSIQRGPTRTDRYANSDEELFREQMRSSAQGDGASPRTFAYLLAKAAERSLWLRLANSRTGQPFGSFRAFLEASESDGGLGMTDQSLKHAAALAGVEDLALTLLREDVEPVSVNGGDRRSSEFQSRGTRLETSADTRTDTAEYVVARLKRDAPDLAERVVRGETSAYAAAQQMGWKKHRVLITSPESVAKRLRKYMSADDLARLISLLLKPEAD